MMHFQKFHDFFIAMESKPNLNCVSKLPNVFFRQSEPNNLNLQRTYDLNLLDC